VKNELTAFDYAITFTLAYEGGFVNDKDDPGKKTKYGITEWTFRHAKSLNLVQAERIEDLTEEEAKRIYYSLYWLPLKCDEMPRYAAILTFDTAVNQGHKWAILHLQKALNDLHLFSKTAMTYRLKEDGIIGPKTITALKDMHFRGFRNDKLTFVRLYCVNRELRYLEIILNRQALKKFAKGWFRRTSELQDFAETFV